MINLMHRAADGEILSICHIELRSSYTSNYVFAVKIKNGPVGALRNNRWAACTAPSKAYTLLTSYLIRLLVTLRKHVHAKYRDFLSYKN